MTSLPGESRAPGATSDEVAALSLPRNLGRGVFKNTSVQIVGRLLIALSRLVVAALIVRTFGRDLFGEFSLILGILMIAEWLLDFGVTEVTVRDIAREPGRGLQRLRVVTAAKGIQIVAAFAVLLAILLALRYPWPIVEAALVGGAGMVFFAGVLVYRIIFRASLTMERDVAGELAAVVVMIPLLWWACVAGAGLTTLVGCHFVSRVVYCGISYLLGRKSFRLSVAGVTWRDVRGSLYASAAIGTVGLLAGLYETLDIILLSKLSTLSDLAYYAGAQRLTWPIRIALASIGATLYPIAAAFWPRSRPDFEQAFQKGLDTVVMLAGAVLCALMAGAAFFMGLIGPDMVDGTPALRILTVLCFFKAISLTVGPVLFVLHAQRAALLLIALAMIVKGIVLAPLAVRFGYLGVAFGSLGVDVIFVLVPMVYLIQRLTRYRVRWLVTVKVALVAAAAAGVPVLLGFGDSLVGAVVAGALYVPLAFLVGAVRWSDIVTLLGRTRP